MSLQPIILKLESYLQHNLNVLLVGRHGVGKTEIIKGVFEKAQLHSLYFSASTMDPWVDMIGIPKEVHEGGKSYLDLIRPKAFAEDLVQAIFLDEANRANAKVRNAMMELIQFKSINGKRFNNLRVVWAAINPEDGEYDTERLDPAQKDRFHVHLVLPNSPDADYMEKKYGNMGKKAVEWWFSLPDKVSQEISPRRLDYSIEHFKRGLSLRDVLPSDAPASNLARILGETFAQDELIELLMAYSRGKPGAAKHLTSKLKDQNFLSKVEHLIITKPKIRGAVLPLLPREKLNSLIVKESLVAQHVLKSQDFSDFRNSLRKGSAVEKYLESTKNALSALPSGSNLASNPALRVRIKRIRTDAVRIWNKFVSIQKISLSRGTRSRSTVLGPVYARGTSTLPTLLGMADLLAKYSNSEPERIRWAFMYMASVFKFLVVTEEQSPLIEPLLLEFESLPPIKSIFSSSPDERLSEVIVTPHRIRNLNLQGTTFHSNYTDIGNGVLLFLGAILRMMKRMKLTDKDLQTLIENWSTPVTHHRRQGLIFNSSPTSTPPEDDDEDDEDDEDDDEDPPNNRVKRKLRG